MVISAAAISSSVFWMVMDTNDRPPNPRKTKACIRTPSMKSGAAGSVPSTSKMRAHTKAMAG